MDEWLICIVMAWYTEAYTVVKTDSGLSESFDVKVVLHQESVHCCLLLSQVRREVGCLLSCCMLMT